MVRDGSAKRKLVVTSRAVRPWAANPGIEGSPRRSGRPGRRRRRRGGGVSRDGRYPTVSRHTRGEGHERAPCAEVVVADARYATTNNHSGPRGDNNVHLAAPASSRCTLTTLSVLNVHRAGRPEPRMHVRTLPQCGVGLREWRGFAARTRADRMVCPRRLNSIRGIGSRSYPVPLPDPHIPPTRQKPCSTPLAAFATNRGYGSAEEPGRPPGRGAAGTGAYGRRYRMSTRASRVVRWIVAVTALAAGAITTQATAAGSGSTAAPPRAHVWMTTPDGAHEDVRPGHRCAFHRGGSSNLTITVDPSRGYQRMDGFGASITDSSAVVLYAARPPARATRRWRDLFAPRRRRARRSCASRWAPRTSPPAQHYTYDDLPAGADRLRHAPLLDRARPRSRSCRCCARR